MSSLSMITFLVTLRTGAGRSSKCSLRVSVTVSCSDVIVSGTLMSSAVKAFDVSIVSKASLAAVIALSEAYCDIFVFSVVAPATVVSATVVFSVASIAV